jgi:hypothetical protein
METPDKCSPWWKHSIFSRQVPDPIILSWLAAKSYRAEHSILESVFL